MDIFNREIDGGKAFDWGRTSSDAEMSIRISIFIIKTGNILNLQEVIWRPALSMKPYLTEVP